LLVVVFTAMTVKAVTPQFPEVGVARRGSAGRGRAKIAAVATKRGRPLATKPAAAADDGGENGNGIRTSDRR
jgi:hypothetical protein